MISSSLTKDDRMAVLHRRLAKVASCGDNVKAKAKAYHDGRTAFRACELRLACQLTLNALRVAEKWMDDEAAAGRPCR